MTTAARQAEADRASAAFLLALNAIGAQTIEESLSLWDDVPATETARTAASFLERAVAMVMSRRERSRDLALAYYRLARALRTGTTIPDPRDPEPTYVTLDQLRSEFAALSQPTRQTPESPPPGPLAPAPTADTPEPQVGVEEDADAEADRIVIEELEELERQQEEADREAERIIREDLESLGPANQERLVSKIDDGRPANEVDVERDSAHEKAGARQAASAERHAMNAGRGEVWDLASRDRRALGYVRLSRTGTPCGWCAMLLSRGAVYRSEASATYDEGDMYHDNCHCYAEPIFTAEQYEQSSLTALNRKYAEEWPRVTRGLSGKAAISAWRYYIRQEQKRLARESQADPATTTSPGG